MHAVTAPTDLLVAVAHHPDLDDEVVERLASHPEPRVRTAVVTRTGVPAALVTAAAADPVASVRAAAAAATTDPDEVSRAVRGSSIQVARKAASNRHLPVDDITWLTARDGTGAPTRLAADIPLVRALLMNPTVPDATARQIVGEIAVHTQPRSMTCHLFGAGHARGPRVAGVGYACAAHPSLVEVFARDVNNDGRGAAARFVTSDTLADEIRSHGRAGLSGLALNPFLDPDRLELTPARRAQRDALDAALAEHGLDLTAPQRWTAAQQQQAAALASSTLDQLLLTHPQLDLDAARTVMTRAGDRHREVVPTTDTVGALLDAFGWPIARLARQTMKAGRTDYANPWSPRVTSLVAGAAVDASDRDLDELAATIGTTGLLGLAGWDTLTALERDWALSALELVRTTAALTSEPAADR